ncbi:MAG: hypothetical protein ACKVPY_07830 [Paracoccaceae bacterium]
MMLTEVTQVPQAALPLAEFRDHLKLGTGFGDEAVQDAVLERSLRAALAAIEGRTGKVLFARNFLLAVEGWSGSDRQVLPLAPVSTVTSVTLRDATGTATVVLTSAWRLIRDFQRPSVASVGASLPAVPDGGAGEIAFIAGFSASWAQFPADLGQAVLLLAAHFHENRHAAGEAGMEIPFGILALLERWRQVRLTAGARQ